MQPKRLNYLKTFLLGFGFFGVSVIWARIMPSSPSSWPINSASAPDLSAFS